MSTEPLPPLSPDEEDALRTEYGLRGELTGDLALDAERECNRLLAALHSVREEMAANQRMRDEEVRNVERWLERVNDSPHRQESWLLMQIEAIAAHVPRYGKKSRELPHGVVGWRTNPERLTVEDPDAALAWARERGLPVKSDVVEGVPHKVLAEAWKATSEVPAGCRVEEEKEVFFVKALEVS